jgi:hypothetical protein
MSARTLLLLLLGSALPAALGAGCGSSGTGNTSTSSGGGGSTATGSTTASTSATGGGGATTTSSTGTGGTGGTPEPCTDFIVAPPNLPPVTVRVVNATSADVYLGPSQADCGYEIGFSLTDASGAALKPNKGHCEFSCADMQLGHCACPPGCVVPDIVKLVAGKHYDILWPRTVFQGATMPGSCYDKTCTAAACYMEKAAQGPLTVKVSGYAGVHCASGACADCTADSSGSCSVPDADHTSGTEHPATVAWNNDDMVTLTLQ